MNIILIFFIKAIPSDPIFNVSRVYTRVTSDFHEPFPFTNDEMQLAVIESFVSIIQFQYVALALEFMQCHSSLIH